MQTTSLLFLALPSQYYTLASRLASAYHPKEIPRELAIETAMQLPIQFVDANLPQNIADVFVRDALPEPEKYGRVVRVSSVEELRALVSGKRKIENPKDEWTVLAQTQKLESDYDHIQEIHWTRKDSVWTLDFKAKEFFVSSLDGTSSRRMGVAEFVIMKTEIQSVLHRANNLHAKRFLNKGFQALKGLDVFQQDNLMKALDGAQKVLLQERLQRFKS